MKILNINIKNNCFFMQIAFKNSKEQGVKKYNKADEEKQIELLKTGAFFCGAGAVLVGLYKGNWKNINESAEEISLMSSKLNKAKDIIVTGKDNVRKLLNNLNNDDFNSNKVFKANMHIHSTKSDGKLSPLEVLNQALECAQKLPAGEKFTFSLTDHDTIDGVLEITDEICKNSDKYSKLNFIPGVELSTKFHNPNLSSKPVQMDFLIYGFDPKNQSILNETQRRKMYLKNNTAALLNSFKEKNPEFSLSIEDVANAPSRTLRHFCSNGYLNSLKKWLSPFLNDAEKHQLDGKIVEFFGDKNYPYDANLDLLNAVKLSNNANAFSSLAHPGKLSFEHINLKKPHTMLVEDIVATFFNSGGDGIESHYMSYDPQASWWGEVRRIIKNLNTNYSRTGGYDTHGRDIHIK